MPAPSFSDLIGLELTFARLAADMRLFGFGPVRERTSFRGELVYVAAFSLHLQCAWRLANVDGVVTGSHDLWTYVGPGDKPEDWEPVRGDSLQTNRLESLLGSPLGTGRSLYYASGVQVTDASSDARTGDFSIGLSSGHRLEGYPCGSAGEQWRLFSPGADDPHLVFEFTDVG